MVQVTIQNFPVDASDIAGVIDLEGVEVSGEPSITPTQIAAGEAPKGKAFRIGGLVKEGSVKRQDMTVRFVITDTVKEIPVAYTGILPDLFRDGKGAVVQGRLGGDGVFAATEVLAKHDENYMPPEAKHAIDQAQKKP